MSEYVRMPEIGYPFAVFGAAAGWLAAGFLATPIVNLTYGHTEPLFTAGCSLIIAAALGRYLTRSVVNAAVFADPSATWARLVVAQAVGGALVGALVGGYMWQTEPGVTAGMVGGALVGLAFLPIGALVVRAARRAARARMGSIVAASDRRAMWGILATTLAGATLLALPDWPASLVGYIAPPWVALGLTLACGAVTVGLLVADLEARTRVLRLDREAGSMERREASDEPREDDPEPEIDFGLGADVLARMARGAAAYRARDRATSLLLGSSAQALAALRDGVRRSAIGLGVVIFALAAHALAAGPEGLHAHLDYRCATRHREDCRVAPVPQIDLSRAER
jgi:MFS family permease